MLHVKVDERNDVGRRSFLDQSLAMLAGAGLTAVSGSAFAQDSPTPTTSPKGSTLTLGITITAAVYPTTPVYLGSIVTCTFDRHG